MIDFETNVIQKKYIKIKTKQFKLLKSKFSHNI